MKALAAISLTALLATGCASNQPMTTASNDPLGFCPFAVATMTAHANKTSDMAEKCLDEVSRGQTGCLEPEALLSWMTAPTDVYAEVEQCARMGYPEEGFARMEIASGVATRAMKRLNAARAAHGYK